ncbi:MAG: hypothetical protein ACKPKO_37805, partial [Candidatus Fonsibacter sp.]
GNQASCQTEERCLLVDKASNAGYPRFGAAPARWIFSIETRGRVESELDIANAPPQNRDDDVALHHKRNAISACVLSALL